MVYRIQPVRHSRFRHFLLAFLRFWFLVFLCSCLLGYLDERESPRLYGVSALISFFASLLLAWLNVRQWERLGWFQPHPREYFLTMVEEGLVIESLAKGFAVYLPWKGFSFLGRRSMIQFLHDGQLRAYASFNGLRKERREALLSTLRRFTGTGLAQHGLFTPEKAAVPFARPAGVAEQPPPIPLATLPAPVPESGYTTATCSNTPEQRRESMRLMMRPGVGVCGFLLLAIALGGFSAAASFKESGFGLSAGLLLFISLYLIARLAKPGRARQPHVAGKVQFSFTETEVVERAESGAWGRHRLPAVEEGRLMRLPHSWCLLNKAGQAWLMVDVEGEAPPPALARYRSVPEPANGLRVVTAFLFLALGLLAGSFLTAGEEKELPSLPSALVAVPNVGALRTFVEAHYLHGELYDTPRLRPFYTEEGELEGYILSFTSSEPAPDADDGRFHLAWVTEVFLFPDGEVAGMVCLPAPWCPCDDWLDGSPEWLEEEKE